MALNKALVIGVLHCLTLCWCQCPNQYLVQPGTVQGSPITCNIFGVRVELQCIVETASGGSVVIRWSFTADRSQAGMILHHFIASDDPRFSSSASSSRDQSTSTLVIRSYDSSYEGFYWCEVGLVFPTVFEALINPSIVVELFTTFTDSQLEPCNNTIFVQTDGQGRCAYGDSEPLVIVPAVTSAMEPETTTTLAEIATTIVEQEVETALNTTTNDDDPCQNGGTYMYVDGVNSFMCSCAPGYTGKICAAESKLIDDPSFPTINVAIPVSLTGFFIANVVLGAVITIIIKRRRLSHHPNDFNSSLAETMHSTPLASESPHEYENTGQMESSSSTDTSTTS